MTAPRTVPRAAFWLLAPLVLGACPTTHYSSPWTPSTDAGACVSLPDDPKHSTADPACAAGPDVDREPNGSLFTAFPLAQEACSGAAIVPGRLAAANDVDLFSFSKCALPFLNPADLVSRATALPTVTVDEADDGTDVCLFAYCALGPTTLDGCLGQGAVTAYLAEGMLGCCRHDKGTLITKVSCDSYQPTVSGLIMARSVYSATAADNAGIICHEPYSLTFSIAPPP